MASPEQEAVAAAAVVEDVLRMHGEGFAGVSGGGGEVVVLGRNIDMAWRKAEVAGELFLISLLACCSAGA
jgi:kinesin family protein C2/C3